MGIPESTTTDTPESTQQVDYEKRFKDTQAFATKVAQEKADAVREVQEETGLQTISLGEFICMTTHTYFDTWLQKDVVKETHWYGMKAAALDAETLVPQTEEDIEKIEWVLMENLPQYLVQTYPTIRSVFDAFNGGSPKF